MLKVINLIFKKISKSWLPGQNEVQYDARLSLSRLYSSKNLLGVKSPLRYLSYCDISQVDVSEHDDGHYFLLVDLHRMLRQFTQA